MPLAHISVLDHLCYNGKPCGKLLHRHGSKCLVRKVLLTSPTGTRRLLSSLDDALLLAKKAGFDLDAEEIHKCQSQFQ